MLIQPDELLQFCLCQGVEKSVLRSVVVLSFGCGFLFHPRKRTTVADEGKRQQRMRLVQPDGEAPYEDVSFEEPESKLSTDLNEARRYAELDRLLYRVLQLHAIHERRIAEESTEKGPSLQRQLYEAQRRLDKIFDEMR